MMRRFQQDECKFNMADRVYSRRNGYDDNCQDGQEEVDWSHGPAWSPYLDLLGFFLRDCVQPRFYHRVGRNMAAAGRVHNRSRCWHKKRN
jgi:hypothetical protein